MNVSENLVEASAVEHAAIDTAFPPSFVTEAQGFSFLSRLALLGGAAGVLTALCVIQISWWLSLAVLLVWSVGGVVAGCVGALQAKKHRSGVGYPADGEAWIRTFSGTYTLVSAVVGAITVVLAVVCAFVFAKSTGANVTPAVLAAIIAAIAVAVMRWISLTAPRWLIFGVR